MVHHFLYKITVIEDYKIFRFQKKKRLQNISHYFNFITSLNDSNLTLLIDEDIIIYFNKIVHTNKFILLIKIIKIPKKKKN